MQFICIFFHYAKKVHRSLFFLLILILFSNSLSAQDIETMVLVQEDTSSYRKNAIELLKKTDELIKSADYKEASITAKKGMQNIHQYNSKVNDSTLSSILLLQINLFRRYAVSSFYLGDYVESMIYYDKTLDNLDLIDTTKIKLNTVIESKARCYNGKAAIYSTQGMISKAVDNFLKSLEMYELIRDSAGIARLYNNLGIVYKNQGEIEQAESYFYKAIELYQNQNHESKIASTYNNLGSLYVQEKDPDKALEYLYRSKALNEKLNSNRSLSHTFLTIGQAYLLKKDYEQAKNYYFKALDIQIKYSDERGQLDSYVSIAKLYTESRVFSKAKEYLLKAEKLNKKMNLLPVKATINQLYFDVYSKENRISKALYYHILFKESADSLKTLEQRSEVSKIQLNYLLNKKEQELKVLNKQRELNELKLQQKELYERQQNIVLIVILTLLLFTLVVVHIIFKRLQLNRKQQIIIQNQKMEMDDKNRILRNAYEEINQQKAEIIAHRNKISLQKDKAFSLFNDLKASIVYAQHIQNALLPDIDQLDDIFNEYFVFNRPHSIVSGDFYWGRTINGWRIFAVADCTGHGVPGALMSMLGITYLNEIVKYKDVVKTSILLEYLRKYIINSLRNAETNNSNRNGMDMAIIAKKPNSNVIYFSGANSNIYIVRQTKNPLIGNSNIIAPAAKNGERLLFEIKGDRMPIGYDDDMNKFTNYIIEIEESDVIYFFTDGYADQFGGDDNKKLKYKRFRELLLEISDQTMLIQKEQIVSFIVNWMGSNRQVDDMLVVGGKLKF
jgi:serine phosphatase RsbU (regulator of sigma subunit)/Tfp pilus assembly protein PilF